LVGVGSDGFLYGDRFGVGSDGLVRLGTGVGNKSTSAGASWRVNPMTAIQRKEKTSAQTPKVVLFIAENLPQFYAATGVPFQ